MTLTTDLLDVLNGKIPEGSMIVKTIHNSDNVELWGINGKGFKIPLEEVENFVGELKKFNHDEDLILKRDEHEVVVPGNRIAKAIQYLEFAKRTGVKLKEFKQIF